MKEGRLTYTQEKIAQFICKGMINAEIAKEMDRTESCIKYHVGNILSALNLKRRSQVIIYFMKKGGHHEKKIQNQVHTG